MVESEEDKSKGFIRQRRNLLIASLVLLFSETTNLKIEKIAAFGNDLVIGQPENVGIALWVLTIYWLVRFYQYSRKEHNGAISLAVGYRVKEIGESAVFKLFANDIKKVADKTSTPLVKVQIGNLQWLNRSRKDLDVSAQIFTPQEGGGLVPFGGPNERYTVTLKGGTLFMLRLRAFINLSIHTPLFTDLVLPYVVFALPVGYLISKYA